jgi:multiple sugar transport system substrate-binding protein
MSASALGGWQLGINRYSKNPEAAEKLVRYLTSPGVQKMLARTVGYKPARKSLYTDKELLGEQPFLAGLYEVFMKARPRPVSPYYMMMTQVMQPEFSAVISGIKTPEDALMSARKQIEHIIRAEE